MFHIPVYCEEIEDCPGMYSRFNALNGANKSQRAKAETVKKIWDYSIPQVINHPIAFFPLFSLFSIGALHIA